DGPAHERIVEKKENGPVKKAVMVPVKIVAFPFVLMGKGMEATLLAVEENNLVVRAEAYRRILEQRHLRILYGVGYDGAGFGGGVEWSPPKGLLKPVFSGAISYKLYQVYRIRLGLSPLFAESLGVSGEARYRYLPQEDFYGIGPNARQQNRTNYKLEQIVAPLSLTGAFFSKALRWDAGVEYSSSHTYSGDDNEWPSTETVFTRAEVPGLGVAVEQVTTSVALSYLGLDNPDDPWSGVHIKTLAAWAEDVEGPTYDYWRAYAEFYGFLPLLGRGNRFGPRSAIGLRAYVDLNKPAHTGGAVPFFDMPRVGGSQTLRGFREFRFTDNNAAVINIEYKYPIESLLEAVLFWDEGQVFGETADFDLSDFRSSYGGGIRAVFHGNVFVRLEVARGAEGSRVIFKFGGGF
ncbi:MAG: BamA/TamA family outer membrane protein, partial [bacterium]